MASEDKAVWGAATGVPGLAALNKGSGEQFARVTYYPAVSCAPGGTCAVGGSYIDGSGRRHYGSGTRSRTRRCASTVTMSRSCTLVMRSPR